MTGCPACGRSWLPAGVGAEPASDVGRWELAGVNWLEVMIGAALGACLQVYLLRRMR